MIFIQRMHLSPRERKIVRKICRIQLRGLEEIIGEHTKVDTRIYELNNGLEYESIQPIAERAYQEFKAVYDDPETFTQLPEDSLSIFKHILFNFVSEKKYPKTKKKLWGKLFKLESISRVTGLN